MKKSMLGGDEGYLISNEELHSKLKSRYKIFEGKKIIWMSCELDHVVIVPERKRIISNDNGCIIYSSDLDRETIHVSIDGFKELMGIKDRLSTVENVCEFNGKYYHSFYDKIDRSNLFWFFSTTYHEKERKLVILNEVKA